MAVNFFSSKKNSRQDRQQGMTGRRDKDYMVRSSLTAKENNHIKQLYQEIGEEYIRLYKGQYHEQLKEKIDLVNEAMDRIADYKKPWHASSGKTVCENCGEEVRDNAFFCNNCGAKIMRVKPPKNTVCPSCHAPIEEFDEYCMECGAKIDHTMDKRTGEKCPRCNAAVLVGASFCMECGYRF